MKLEQQICSLELAKKLKELEVEHTSHFYWVGYDCDEEDNHSYVLCFENPEGGFKSALSGENIKGNTFYQAFTVAELGEMLPEMFYGESFNGESTEYDQEGIHIISEKINLEWRCEFGDGSENDDELFEDLPDELFSGHRCRGFKAKTEADARAMMLIYLIENKLIKI